MKRLGRAAVIAAVMGIWAAPLGAEDTGIIRGTVADVDGKPLAAWITFPELELPATASLPSDGGYELELPAGSYLVEFSADGHSPLVRPIRSRAGEIAVYDVRLEKFMPAATLRGRLLTQDGEPIVGVVSFVVPDRIAIAANPETGRYQDSLTPGNYKVKAAAAGYAGVETGFTAKPGEEIELDFVLRPREGMEKIEVTEKAIEIKEKILFASGKHEVLFTSYPILDEIYLVLSENQHIELSIEGHTDAVGKAEANLELSRLRAEAVRQYLIDRGIAESRLTAIGYGLEKPIASNDSIEGREKNRRVEFNIVSARSGGE